MKPSISKQTANNGSIKGEGGTVQRVGGTGRVLDKMRDLYNLIHPRNALYKNSTILEYNRILKSDEKRSMYSDAQLRNMKYGKN